MKYRGKRGYTTLNIPRSITLSPLHFMLYRGKSITFVTVYGSMGIAHSCHYSDIVRRKPKNTATLTPLNFNSPGL